MEEKIRTGLIQTFIKELNEIPATRKHLREFGWVVGGVLSLLAAYWCWRGKSFWVWAAAPGVALLVLGTLLPTSLKIAHRLWMGLAVVMGFVMTRVILTLFYYLFLTPIAGILRLTGQYPESFRKTKPGQSTHWTSRPDAAVDPSRYENQF